ncbi:hypothetical protein GDN83_10975 [Gordonia jinghuaiqii]|uniref:Acyl-CoA dehydrogenase family protein n=1 Tax=Gordonia jinghuaiqii TaxID=2758710 RepID=A0A7D7R255_9ACTN|nr:acyl-CoA dehydrogenase [Gordonia jinghuaiqii]MCR5978244.1 hypothetical protein [Gordonia jinghuaiqii]QMT01307.1 acyl-CoA dehydrogenase family protein [Gordonia jinghuaiqii]
MTGSSIAEASRPSDWTALVPTPESLALAASARDHFAKLGTRQLAREALADARTAESLWHSLVDAGYPQIGVPESRGGIGDAFDLTVLLEEAGRALLPAPLLTTCASIQLLLQAEPTEGEEVGHAHLAFGVGRGRVHGTRAHSEVLTVVDGHGATEYVIVLDDPGVDIHVVTVDPRATGVRSTAKGADLDASRSIVEIALDRAETTSVRTVPRTSVAELLSPVRMCIAADLLGVAAGALHDAIEHVQRRHQFGRPLGAFQAVKHQLVEAYVSVEKTRSLVHGSALAVTDSPREHETTVLTTLALATALRTSIDVSGRYIQLLGAMGVTFESDAHLYLRRAHQTAQATGSAAALFAQAAALQRSTHV